MSTRTLTRSERIATIDMAVPANEPEYVDSLLMSMGRDPSKVALLAALELIYGALVAEAMGLPITAPEVEDFFLDGPDEFTPDEDPDYFAADLYLDQDRMI